MADFIPLKGPVRNGIKTPLTLTQLQGYVEGFIRFIDLPSGDLLVVNEAAQLTSVVNTNATSIAGRLGPIYGNAVLCSPAEIE